MDLNVFLHSGGTRVAVHVGALRALEEFGGKVAAWAGVSAGSLVAAVRASGFTQQQAYDLMLHTDYSRFMDVRPLSLMTGFGLFAGAAFERWLDGVLRGCRFRDLDVPLTVVATDVATGEPAFFSNCETPEMKVATAVRCSISIPGIFAVRKIAGRSFVDGCLTHTEPHQLFPDSRRMSAVVRMTGTRKETAPTGKRLSLSRYIHCIAEILSHSVDAHTPSNDWDYDLRVNVGPSRGTEFRLDPAEKQALHDLAYRQCRQWLLERGPFRWDVAACVDAPSAAVPRCDSDDALDIFGWSPTPSQELHAALT